MTFPEQTLPSAIAPALLLSPPADLFATRAARLQHLAEGHSLGVWLNWLAELSHAQQHALDQLPILPIFGSFDPLQPILRGEQDGLAPLWQQVFRDLLEALAESGPDSLKAEHGRLSALSEDELGQRQLRCQQVASGESPAAGRDIADILVAAALQVVWTGAVRQLALPETTSVGDLDTCPCCGGAPVGSIVMAGEGKGGLRYRECSLCATRWNAVRARCTLCSEGAVVNYLGIDGGNPAVQAETCDACHGYIKTFFQDKDRQVDVVADDLASLVLDVLVGEQGYSRGTPNLFLSEGETV